MSTGPEREELGEELEVAGGGHAGLFFEAPSREVARFRAAEKC